MKSSRLPLSACAILLLAVAYCAVHGLVTAEWMQSPSPSVYREWASVEAGPRNHCCTSLKSNRNFGIVKTTVWFFLSFAIVYQTFM